MDEPQLVKMYMDLTGSTESAARNVLMYVTSKDGGDDDNDREQSKDNAETARPGPGKPVQVIIAFFLAAGLARAETPERTNSTSFVSSPITLQDAVNFALQQNPSLLKVKKEIEASHGVALQTRAIVVPKAGITGNYGAVQQIDIDTFRTPTGVTFGNNQTWGLQLRVVQSIYEGGRMLSSVRTARLLQEQAMLNYQTAVADTVLLVQLAFYDTLLGVQQITVQEASVALLERELADNVRRYEAGTVPRFNVLRAEVELANEKPRLIAARNKYRIAKNNLANILGFNVPKEVFEDIPLTLAGSLEDEPFAIELPKALQLALARRTELESLRKTQALRKEDVVDAKAGYRPALQGYIGYDTHNSMLSQDISVERHGWIAGAQLTWNIFDGLRTRGRIMETRANLERSEIDLDDAGRRIELEVRTAYSNFIEARELLESQKKVQEQAQESLRLAQARAEAGTGTQLDVLSSQTALTQARTTQIEALHAYDVARARLQRAIGANLPGAAQP